TAPVNTTGTDQTCTIAITVTGGANASTSSVYMQIVNPAVTLPVPLTVTKTGAGQGTVRSMPSGIDCGTICMASFALGSIVTLQAEAAAGSTFGGWSTPCSTMNLTCPV